MKHFLNDSVSNKKQLIGENLRFLLATYLLAYRLMYLTQFDRLSDEKHCEYLLPYLDKKYRLILSTSLSSFAICESQLRAGVVMKRKQSGPSLFTPECTFCEHAGSQELHFITDTLIILAK